MSAGSRIVLLSLVAWLAGCATAFDRDAALAVAPYEIEEGGRIVIDATLNGTGPYRFAIDTGASISVVFGHVSKRLALKPLPDSEVIIHGAVTSGRYPLLNIADIGVGTQHWTDARIASMPGNTDALRGIDGILGIDFLERYAVGFSKDEGIVRLYPPELVRARRYKGWGVISLEPQKIGERGASLYFFDVKIKNRRIRAVFDLGAGLNVMNWPASIQLGLPPVAYGLKSRGEVQGAIDNLQSSAVIESVEVHTGTVTWRRTRFYVADLDIFATLGLRSRPAAILGAGLFTKRDFVIDFEGERLLVDLTSD